MSQFRIQRRKISSPKNRTHSLENQSPPVSKGRFFQLISKRRTTTIQPTNSISRQNSTKINRQNSNNFRRQYNTKINRQNSQQIRSKSFINNKMEQALRHYREKNIPKALKMFKQLFKINPSSAQLAFYIGSCLLNQNQNESSIFYLNQCVTLNPLYDRNAYLYLSINYKMLKQYPRARKSLQTGLTKFPNFQQGLFYKGKLEMKMKEFDTAADSFNRCLTLNNTNILAKIFLGDCLYALGHVKEAIRVFKEAIELGKVYSALAVRKLVGVLMFDRQWKEALVMIDRLLEDSKDDCQLCYWKGVASYQVKERNNALVYFQSCLNESNNLALIIEVIKYMIKLCLEENDYLGAQYLLNRAHRLSVPENEIKEWKTLVEGINDMVKRKFDDANVKLQSSLKEIHRRKVNQTDRIEFQAVMLPFYAYSLFASNRQKESIAKYQYLLELQPDSPEKFNKLMCEGLVSYQKGNHSVAEEKFELCRQCCPNRAEVAFVSAINLIQSSKPCSQSAQAKIVITVLDRLYLGQQISPKFSLLYFYHSLVLLYMQRPSLQTIQTAIQYSEESISQYYFIKALTHSLNGHTLQGLQALNKAIETDENIMEFYKERSKYYFLLERYDDAVDDCLRVVKAVGDDEEARLLLTFYYYANDEPKKSYEYLSEAITSTELRFKEFEQAVRVRIGIYENIGIVGPILKAICDPQSSKTLPGSYLADLQRHIQQRIQYSQFSVYFYHLLLATYYATIGKYTDSLSNLFGCLEEIQFIIDETDEKNNGIETDSMVNEVKFNIVIVTLLKKNYAEVMSFINVFTKETNSIEVINQFSIIVDLIEDKKVERCQIEAVMFKDEAKLSDNLKPLKIDINGNTYITKMLIFYPMKLRFNIAPEFDSSFLFNFGVEKVDNKLIAPWIKTKDQQLLFTEQIRNQSVMLSETEKAFTPMLDKPLTPLLESQSRSLINLKQRFRLSSKLEQKLQRIIHK